VAAELVLHPQAVAVGAKVAGILRGSKEPRGQGQGRAGSTTYRVGGTVGGQAHSRCKGCEGHECMEEGLASVACAHQNTHTSKQQHKHTLPSKQTGARPATPHPCTLTTPHGPRPLLPTSVVMGV